MTDTARFHSHVRRGGTPEAQRGGRALDTVTTAVSTDQHHVRVRAEFLTPGPHDVRAMRPEAIRRRMPAPGTWTADEEDRPYVEFAEADLPWRYSHRSIDVGGHSVPVPWCVLVVGEPGEVDVVGGHATLGPQVQAQHPVEHAHRWAHVQGAGTGGVARVLCARTPTPPGTAFADDVELVAALVVPWDADGNAVWPPAGGGAVRVRCLTSWRFRTGKAGGFRELATELHPADGDPIGTVTAIREPGGQVVEVPGALTTATLRAPLPGEIDLGVLGDDSDGPPLDRVVVGPPAYGAPWLPGGHDGVRDDVDAADVQAPATWTWPVEANADLRHRIVAGLGVQAGTDLQEEIVASAARRWGTGEAAAEAIAGCVLGTSATASVWRRRAPADVAARLRLLGPAAAGLTTTVDADDGSIIVGPTLRDAVSAPADPAVLPFPAGAMGPVLGRVVPAGGPIDRHSRDGATATAALVDVVRNPDTPPPTPWDEYESGISAPEDLDAGHVDGTVLATWEADPDDPAEDELRELALNALSEHGFPVDGERPPDRKPISLDVLVGCLEGALDPAGGGPARARVTGRFDGLDPLRPFAPLEDCPVLDMPAWRWLRDQAPHWLLPGAENLAPGEVVALRTNPAFVEAFLLGLNGQALAELRWRGHPVRDECTPIRRFWERASATGDARPDDIRGVQDWMDSAGAPIGRIGTHAPAAVMGEQLVVVVRSELFRRYPRTLLYLAEDDGSGHARIDGTRTPPESVTAVSPDLTMFAFRLAPNAIGNRWIVIEEQPDGIRFWLEERPDPAPPGTPDDGAARALRHVRRPVRVIMPGAATLGVGP